MSAWHVTCFLSSSVSRRRSPAAHAPAVLFTLGGVLARWWHGGPVWLPWAITAGVLLVGGCWDPMVRGAEADFILIGLAGYEMAIGLTEEERASTTPAQ